MRSEIRNSKAESRPNPYARTSGALKLAPQLCSDSDFVALTGVTTDYAPGGHGLDSCATYMKPDVESSVRSFLVELVVYAALVAIYYFLVLEFLGGWLNHLFQSERRLYAGLALGVIIAPGFLLELLTRALLAWIKPRTEDG